MFGHDDATDVAVLETPSAEKVEGCLRHSSYLALRNVTCQMRDDVVVLRGYLPTYYLKQMAQSIAIQLDGVGKVVNEIEVVAAPPIASRR